MRTERGGLQGRRAHPEPLTDTAVGCAPRTIYRGQKNGAQAHPTSYSPIPPLPVSAAPAVRTL